MRYFAVTHEGMFTLEHDAGATRAPPSIKFHGSAGYEPTWTAPVAALGSGVASLQAIARKADGTLVALVAHPERSGILTGDGRALEPRAECRSLRLAGDYPGVSPLPEGFVDLLLRLRSCAHFAGESGSGDEAREAEIAAAIERLNCADLRRQHAALVAETSNDAFLSATLSGWLFDEFGTPFRDRR